MKRAGLPSSHLRSSHRIRRRLHSRKARRLAQRYSHRRRCHRSRRTSHSRTARRRAYSHHSRRCRYRRTHRMSHTRMRSTMACSTLPCRGHHNHPTSSSPAGRRWASICRPACTVRHTHRRCRRPYPRREACMGSPRRHLGRPGQLRLRRHHVLRRQGRGPRRRPKLRCRQGRRRRCRRPPSCCRRCRGASGRTWAGQFHSRRPSRRPPAPAAARAWQLCERSGSWLASVPPHASRRPEACELV